MTVRWPLHPTPVAGEALSSWLVRIAAAMRVDDEVLMHDLGYHLPARDTLIGSGIDVTPPDGLACRVAERTGVPVERIESMSLAGYCPWLIEDLDPLPDGFEIYTRQMSILLPPGRRLKRDVPGWRAWLAPCGPRWVRACPRCVPDVVTPYPYQLTWLIPLMLSCPVHRCWLRPCTGIPGRYASADGAGDTEPVVAPGGIQAMDAWTWQAITTGWADLPCHRVHAAVWFRLLRTLLDELGATIAECGTARRVVRQVWEMTDHPVRAGQYRWRPYEQLPAAAQSQTLEAAAAAIDAIRLHMITGLGRDAALFLPEPPADLVAGKPRRRTSQAGEPVSDEPAQGQLWDQVHGDLVQWVEAARHDPQAARRLFALAMGGRRNTDDYSKMCAMFTRLDIPADYVTGLAGKQPIP